MGNFHRPPIKPVKHPVQSQDYIKPVMLLRRNDSLNTPCYPYGIAIQKCTHHIFVTDGRPFGRISIFTSSFNFITTFNYPGMLSPCGIAIQNDNIFVSDTAGIVFSFQEDIGFCQVSSVSGRSFNFLGLRGIALSQDGRLYIAEQYHDRIQVLNSDDLKLIYRLSHRSLKNPVNVIVNESELYVLGFGVHVFSLNGDMHRSIIQQKVGSFTILSSRFFCMDSQNIIITDSNNNRIQVYSNQGQLIYSIITGGEFDRILQYSRGIAMTSESNIVVACVDGIYQFKNPINTI
ncbi:PEP-CTERM domain protein [Oopsacas minuta]|uniref:PEP-CTERM domain protein n=1 Tax=Oopsacas minuta TaxID=111878 RepID=A0AAV7JW56_9METZ|nr:PEP-CTERM domain protein [Oopsacas minuta]